MKKLRKKNRPARASTRKPNHAPAHKKKMRKMRGKSPQARASTRKPNRAPAHKRFAARPPAVAPKPRPGPVSRVKPAGVLAPEPARLAASGSDANIQVPRDITPTPDDDASGSHVSAPPDADESS